MRKRDDITKGVLENLLKQGLTPLEISFELDASYSSITQKMRGYGIRRERNSKLQYDEERVKKYLQEGRTRKEIAKLMGVRENTINKWFSKYGLKKYEQKKPADKRRKCSTCIYREKNKSMGNCDYALKKHHSRGCPVLGCTVYVREENGRKHGKRKIQNV